MSFLSWGKCLILVKDLETASTKWLALPDQVEGSTQLNSTAGNKTEATVEGGEVEDTRYGASKYELVTQIRMAKARKQVIPDYNGKVLNKYAICIIPEDPAAPVLFMHKSTVSLLDNFNAGDGGSIQYTFSANKPDTLNSKGGKNELISWGYATLGTKGTDATLGVDTYESVTVVDINDATNKVYDDTPTDEG